jgi:hypothetical protein
MLSQDGGDDDDNDEFNNDNGNSKTTISSSDDQKKQSKPTGRLGEAKQEQQLQQQQSPHEDLLTSDAKQTKQQAHNTTKSDAHAAYLVRVHNTYAGRVAQVKREHSAARLERVCELDALRLLNRELEMRTELLGIQIDHIEREARRRQRRARAQRMRLLATATAATSVKADSTSKILCCSTCSMLCLPLVLLTHLP